MTFELLDLEPDQSAFHPIFHLLSIPFMLSLDILVSRPGVTGSRKGVVMILYVTAIRKHKFFTDKTVSDHASLNFGFLTMLDSR